MEQRINLDRMEQAAELFGSFDGNMKQLEQRYGVALVFRDSELKITGEDPEAVDKAARVVKSLITLIGGGETLTDQNVRYCMQMVEEDGDDKVARLAGDCICITSQGQAHQAQDRGPAAPIARQYPGEHHHHRRGACRHRQDLSGGGHGGKGLPGQGGQPHHPHPPGGGGRGEAGLSARRSAAARWTPICGRCTTRCSTCWGRRPTRSYVERGNIEVAPLAYMRGPHPGRQLHHPGRGAEHHPGADEDVPHPAGVRLQDGHHRGHHPDRPAGRARSPA